MTRTVVWAAGQPLTRAHSHEFGSTEFDARATANARFSPLHVAGRRVPVMYAGDGERTAAAETILRNLPQRPAPRRVAADHFRSWQWSRIRPTRDLRLVAIDRTLPDATTLVDGDATTYHASRAAAGSLLAAVPEADGLVWCSHQLHDTPSQGHVDAAGAARCVLLVSRIAGAGVDRAELEVDGPSIPFWLPDGMGRLDSIALDLDVTVVRR